MDLEFILFHSFLEEDLFGAYSGAKDVSLGETEKCEKIETEQNKKRASSRTTFGDSNRGKCSYFFIGYHDIVERDAKRAIASRQSQLVSLRQINTNILDPY